MGEPASRWCHAVRAWWDREIAERLPAGLQAEGDTAQWEHHAAGHRGGHGVTLFNTVPKLSNWNMSGHLCNLSGLKIRSCVFIVPLLQLEICHTGMFGCKIYYFASCKREMKERSLLIPVNLMPYLMLSVRTHKHTTTWSSKELFVKPPIKQIYIFCDPLSHFVALLQITYTMSKLLDMKEQMLHQP